jgi:hypothetical protein
MLAISTIPASAGASSSTWAACGTIAPVLADGSGLLSSVDARGSSAAAARCAVSDTDASVPGVGLRLLSVAAPTMSQVCSSPWSTGSDDGISCDNSRIHCQHPVLYGKYSTTLLEELTSWAVDLVIFSFLVARFRATLRGLLGSAGRLDSRLACLSTMRGILGSLGRLNLERS